MNGMFFWLVYCLVQFKKQIFIHLSIHLILIFSINFCSIKLGLSNTDQNDDVAVESNNRSNNIKKTKSFFSCFNCCLCGVNRKKIEEDIKINPDISIEKMNNLFKQDSNNKDDNISSSSSVGNLSANQLVIRPIKSLSSNATGSGRNKVELKPGCSLMDWIRLTNSGKDFTCNTFGQRKVTGTELAQHNKLDDAWTSIQGNVFNITPYFDFHPGGVDELFRAAGKESTQLFKQIHAWVNWGSILQKCRIGFLIPGDDVQFAELDKVEDKSVKNLTTEAIAGDRETINSEEIFNKNLVKLNETESLYEIDINKRFKIAKPIINLNKNIILENELKETYWIDDMELFDLFFNLNKTISEDNLMIDITESRMIKVKIYLIDNICYSFNCRLPGTVKDEIKFELLEDSKLLKIRLIKLEKELWAGQISSDNYIFELINQTSQNTFYRDIKLIKKNQLTHDVYHFQFKIPDTLFIPVRFGNHLALRININDEKIFRYYTVVPSCFLNDKEQDEETKNYEYKKELNFIIKIYNDGQLTSKLNQLKLNKTIEISDVFSIDLNIENVLLNKKNIYLLAAGTGITPMLSILYLSKKLFKNLDNELTIKDKEIKLIFCNKTDQDIILKDKLEQFIETNSLDDYLKYGYVNVLSRPNSNWLGLKGRLNNELIKDLFEFNDEQQNEFLFLCGPDEFNLNALSILDSIYHLKEDSYFVFAS